jgi:hypothetical protein
MKRINNYHDLVAEKERLQQKLTLLKREMNGEIQEIKEKFKPVGTILSLFGGSKEADNGTGKLSLLKMGANFGIDMLVGPKLAKAGWLARVLIPPLLRGISSTVLGKFKKAS